jgi:RNA 3'-terminal phosphate cyclase (ATP)
MDFLEIDGSFGEGGGQIVRTAITLSSIMKKPIKIKNIRKNRKTPGLKPQHLTALKILKKICNSDLDQIKIGSTSLDFNPKDMQSLDLKEDIGTAGSISLILQVLIPAVAISKKTLKLSIKGGTNVIWSPTIDYTQTILKEAYARMGIDFSIDVIKRGYYPKGGGIIELEVSASEKINSIILTQRKTKNVKLFCTFSKMDSGFIKKEIKEIKEKLIENNLIIGIDSLFDYKTKQFQLDLEEFIQNKLGVDENLADMLVLPASLANGITIFQVENISKHLETNLFVASKITGCKYGIGKLRDGYEVRIEGVSYSSIK